MTEMNHNYKERGGLYYESDENGNPVVGEDGNVRSVENPPLPMRHVITGEQIFARMTDPYMVRLTETMDFSEGKYPKRCCICGKDLQKHSFHPNGNNPDPVKTVGRCCDECDTTKVRSLRKTRFTNGLRGVRSDRGFVGWGSFGITYWKEDGWKVEWKKQKGWIIQTTLLHHGKVMKKKRTRIPKHRFDGRREF